MARLLVVNPARLDAELDRARNFFEHFPQFDERFNSDHVRNWIVQCKAGLVSMMVRPGLMTKIWIVQCKAGLGLNDGETWPDDKDSIAWLIKAKPMFIVQAMHSCTVQNHGTEIPYTSLPYTSLETDSSTFGACARAMDQDVVAEDQSPSRDGGGDKKKKRYRIRKKQSRDDPPEHPDGRTIISDKDTEKQLSVAYEASAKRPASSSKRFKPPHGWVQSPTFHQAMHNIAPVKTPLCQSFALPPGVETWTPAQCVQACGGVSMVDVIIDLTATDRYYSPDDVPFGVRYLKLKLAGRKTPSEEELRLVLGEFSAAAARNHVAIIHCTHGLNRTGYIVVCALVELYSYSVSDAVDLFCSLRPPGLFREEYAEALRERYTAPVRLPPPPPWASGAHR